MLPGVLRNYSDPADGCKIVRGGTWRARKVLVLFPQQIRAQRARLGRVQRQRDGAAVNCWLVAWDGLAVYDVVVYWLFICSHGYAVPCAQ